MNLSAACWSMQCFPIKQTKKVKISLSGHFDRWRCVNESEVQKDPLTPPLAPSPSFSSAPSLPLYLSLSLSRQPYCQNERRMEVCEAGGRRRRRRRGGEAVTERRDELGSGETSAATGQQQCC